MTLSGPPSPLVHVQRNLFGVPQRMVDLEAFTWVFFARNRWTKKSVEIEEMGYALLLREDAEKLDADQADYTDDGPPHCARAVEWFYMEEKYAPEDIDQVPVFISGDHVELCDEATVSYLEGRAMGVYLGVSIILEAFPSRG